MIDVTKIGRNILKYIPFVLDIYNALTRNVGESKPVDHSSSAEDIDTLIEEFEKYKSMIYPEISKMEGIVQDEVSGYVKDCVECLEQYQEILGKYSIHLGKVKQRLKEINASLEKDLEEQLDKELSLNNRDLLLILRMMPGKRKQESMELFMQKTFGKVLDEYCFKIRKKLANIYEEIEEKVMTAVNSVIFDIGQYSKKIELIKDDENKENVNKIKQEAIFSIADCTVLEKILTEV